MVDKKGGCNASVFPCNHTDNLVHTEISSDQCTRDQMIRATSLPNFPMHSNMQGPSIYGPITARNDRVNILYLYMNPWEKNPRWFLCHSGVYPRCVFLKMKFQMLNILNVELLMKLCNEYLHNISLRVYIFSLVEPSDIVEHVFSSNGIIPCTM